MNPTQLLTNFETIADAPDATPRLRRFILDLAVRGKLVQQDPIDEPALELLKPIVEEGFDQANLPRGWRRRKIGTLLDFQYGKGLGKGERTDTGPVPVFGSNGVVGYTNAPLTTRPAIIVGRKGSAGALNLCDGPSWTTDVAYYVEAPSFIDIHFLMNALTALDLEKLGKGVKPGLSRSDAYEQLLDVPPFAEQRRIVARVDELMKLCDKLETARAEREARRDRLSAASLARLNIPDPACLQSAVRFAIDVLPVITKRPDQIQRLRQTILNLAVRGKLVPQNPKDQPASELLKLIEKEKNRLVATNSIRKERPLPRLSQNDYPFHVPKSWQWCRLRALATNLGDGIHGTPSYSENGVCFFINGNNLSNGRIVIKPNTKTVSIEEMEVHKRPLSERSVLVSINGTLGNVGFYNGELVILGKSACYFNLTEFTSKEYVKLVLESPYFIGYANAAASRTTIQNLSLGAMNEFPAPIPPLAEQLRIVAKVEELITLCDRLWTSLIAGEEHRSGLMRAILSEALQPAEERDEAA